MKASIFFALAWLSLASIAYSQPQNAPELGTIGSVCAYKGGRAEARAKHLDETVGNFRMAVRTLAKVEAG